MQILITGSTGFVGRALTSVLTAAEHQVTRLVRGKDRTGTGIISWQPEDDSAGMLNIESHDVAIHLAGENIAAHRWTAEQKNRIRNSRVQGTKALCKILLELKQPPKTLLCASAIGYYGDRGDEILNEQSPPGKGFLSDVCREWEAASAAAVARGLRVVHLRFGMILSRSGGALATMLPPFKLGIGGVIGNGRQYVSWITLSDAVAAIEHAINEESLSGPVNVVAPYPITNREFTKTLGNVLRRPTFFPLPAFAALWAFGEMADALLLASARAEPQHLLATGFSFRHAELDAALHALLG